METYAIRLLPGQDLKRELDALVRLEGWAAACVLTGIGSLTRAAVRFADQEGASVLEGPLEIVSLGGTLSRDGSHLHVSVGGGDGSVSAGHLTEGAIVYTTAEIVVGILPGWRFTRRLDPATGYAELAAERVRREGGTDEAPSTEDDDRGP